MTKVIVRNGNVDGALRTFKQKNVKDGLLKEVRKREAYIKPGERRRNAKKEAIKNSRRKDRTFNRAA
jgi:small subunit ribosomal protein S21